MKCVLIVEDDKEIAAIERDYLEIHHIKAEIAPDGVTALDMLKAKRYDLLLLDVMMPFKDGFELCKEIRNVYDVPILLVTAKTESVDRIRGLGLGADDYISKPFDPAELVARVKSHLARYERLTSGSKERGALPKETEEVIAVEDLYIVPQGYKVFVRGEEVKLTTREFELLLFLSSNPNIVFSKEKLFERIWGGDYIGDNATVTVHINRIRSKIEKDSSNPQYIDTVWGAGYRFNKT
ncbi:response regulator transcription factor [Paenibacillus macerans]|uniref:response regulator transcription factor n=1 Tax=Paenibacillus macerans TaxID=44252 RepID=UPI000EDC024E|nr:response regulator transcription factor [Paenibacillus macerans]MBS5914158.1 response regulator transcription factor [Paenibacillus macerans]MEC0138189.1 response regulator transcription factor [Paenibacillus macerans]GBK65976.1 DNA-binding response regulator [Paenibacillus macerans]GBK72305.1 DNA-binding response regulator [Paenibacillus macerans]GIP12468.1 DNA-binding response regulator [Paenibacillus macerans]